MLALRSSWFLWIMLRGTNEISSNIGWYLYFTIIKNEIVIQNLNKLNKLHLGLYGNTNAIKVSFVAMLFFQRDFKHPIHTSALSVISTTKWLCIQYSRNVWCGQCLSSCTNKKSNTLHLNGLPKFNCELAKCVMLD